MNVTQGSTDAKLDLPKDSLRNSTLSGGEADKEQNGEEGKLSVSQEDNIVALGVVGDSLAELKRKYKKFQGSTTCQSITGFGERIAIKPEAKSEIKINSGETKSINWPSNFAKCITHEPERENSSDLLGCRSEAHNNWIEDFEEEKVQDILPLQQGKNFENGQIISMQTSSSYSKKQILPPKLPVFIPP